MRIRLGFAPVVLCLAALACLPCASCGTGGVTVIAGFDELVIGPAGGHGAAQNVSLDVPPGAFSTDHSVAIMPQPTPLPIQQPTDGSTIDYFGGIMCIGPLGLGLDIPGHVRCCYTAAGFPTGLGENDLVLLEWDDVIGMMVVSQTAVQSLVSHCFDDDSYMFLGHIAVGIRTPPARDFAFLPENQTLAVGRRQMAGEPPIYLASSTGALVPSALVGTEGAHAFIPATNGGRILFSEFVVVPPAAAQETLNTIDVISSTTREVVHPSDDRDAGDPLFGWIRGQDKAFFIRAGSPSMGAVQPLGVSSFFDVFAEVPGDGSTARTDVFDVQDTFFVTDVRQSPDGKKILIRSTDFAKPTPTSRLDVITPAGAVIGSDIPGIVDPASSIAPRWLPDSSGVYFVDATGKNVKRVNPDGTGLSTLYALGPSLDTIREFVVSPDYDAGDLANSHCAYVRREQIASAIRSRAMDASFTYDDCLVVDRLTGGALTANCDLEDGATINEMVYHPDGKSVALDLTIVSKGTFEQTEVYDASDASSITTFGGSLARIDVSRDTGKILVFAPLGGSGPEVRLYDSDWNNGVVLDLNGVPGGVARWLHSWRTAPSQFDSLVR